MTAINNPARLSPFYNGGSTYDIAGYLAANSITMASNDWVIISLWINGYYTGGFTDATMGAYCATMRSQLDGLIAAWKAGVPGARVGIMLSIPHSQDKDHYATAGHPTRERWRWQRDFFLRMLINIYDTPAQETAKTFVLPHGLAIDPDVGMADRVHPTFTANGYYGLGRGLAAFLKYHA